MNIKPITLNFKKCNIRRLVSYYTAAIRLMSRGLAEEHFG